MVAAVTTAAAASMAKGVSEVVPAEVKVVAAATVVAMVAALGVGVGAVLEATLAAEAI